MVSYPRRLQSGHFICYLNRTYHVLTTRVVKGLDVGDSTLYSASLRAHFPVPFIEPLGIFLQEGTSLSG
jgi:hypothetical protein